MVAHQIVVRIDRPTDSGSECGDVARFIERRRIEATGDNGKLDLALLIHYCYIGSIWR